MAQTDTNLPRFIKASTLAKKITCDIHGDREIWMQFNPPTGNTVPDIARLRCVDCLEEVIPFRLRSVV